jgi:mRNA interferase MazF
LRLLHPEGELLNIDLEKTQNYLEWLSKKIYLDAVSDNAKKRVVKRGEVYRCSLGLGIGSEESKQRPCVVIQYDAANSASPNTIVAPITHTHSHLPVVVPITTKQDSGGNILLDGNVLLGNIVCVSKARLGDYVTTLSTEEMDSVDEAIAISVDIKRHYDKLENIHKDKMVYVEKLKAKVGQLQNDVETQKVSLEILSELQALVGAKDIHEFREKIMKIFS